MNTTEANTPNQTPGDGTKTLIVSSDKLLETVREIIAKAEYHHITINNMSGHMMLEVPVTGGLGGAILAPVISLDVAAIAAFGAQFELLLRNETPVGSPAITSETKSVP